MIKLVKSTSPIQDENGDILSGSAWMNEWITENLLNQRQGFFLGPFSQNPWQALSILEVDYSELKNEVQYQCPWTNNVYFRFVPYAVLTSDVKKWRKGKFSSENFDFHFDTEWHQRELPRFKLEDSSVIRAFVGHGYEQCILPYDGSIEWKIAAIKFDNGDDLIGFLHVWYNK
jgi:hypothetical protein